MCCLTSEEQVFQKLSSPRSATIRSNMKWRNDKNSTSNSIVPTGITIRRSLNSNFDHFTVQSFEMNECRWNISKWFVSWWRRRSSECRSKEWRKRSSCISIFNDLNISFLPNDSVLLISVFLFDFELISSVNLRRSLNCFIWRPSTIRSTSKSVRLAKRIVFQHSRIGQRTQKENGEKIDEFNSKEKESNERWARETNGYGWTQGLKIARRGHRRWKQFIVRDTSINKSNLFARSFIQERTSSTRRTRRLAGRIFFHEQTGGFQRRVTVDVSRFKYSVDCIKE